MHGVGKLPENRSCRAGSVLVARHCTGCEGSSPKTGICPLGTPVEATPEGVVEQECALPDGAKMIFELARSSGVVVNSSTSTTGVVMVAISVNGCHMPNQRRIERGSVSRARESGGMHRWRPDNSVCLFIRRGRQQRTMQSTVYLITLRLLILPLNRLPSQHEGGVSILGYPDQPTNHFVLPTPVARGGFSPTGSSFVLRIPRGDGRSPGLPGPVSYSVPDPTRPCSDTPPLSRFRRNEEVSCFDGKQELVGRGFPRRWSSIWSAQSPFTVT